MDREKFTKQFEYLCLGFDVDPPKKEDRLDAYFKSKLGKMDELEFEELIVKAIEELNVTRGHIPSIQQLLAFRLSIASTDNEALDELYQMKKEMSPKEILENLTPSEAAAMARCPICNNCGFVVMEKDGYTFSGMTCTCKKGKEKERTSLGRESGCYTKYLKKGYMVQGTYEPEGGAQFYKRKHMAEDMEIQMAYNKYIKTHGEEPVKLEDFYIPKKEKSIMRQYLSLEDAKKHGGKDVWPCGPKGREKPCGEIYNFFIPDGDKKIDSYKCKQEHLHKCAY